MIECLNVAFTYDGKRNALDGITLSVHEGEFLCVLGGNGSGKSTLAKHLNALLLPDSGTVTVNGNDTADARTLYVVRSTAGMVFQNPDDQLVASVVEDDVAFGPENLGVPTDELAKRVKQALEEVGLSGFEKHETNALSGGQKQRVAIAGVLAMHPKVLILDEASAMLDPRGRAGLMRVCQELNAQGMTIILITHFMEEAAKAHRVVVLQNGRIALEGSPKDVLARTDVLQNLNLDTPFACRMSRRLQELDVNVDVTISETELAQTLTNKLAHASDNADPAVPSKVQMTPSCNEAIHRDKPAEPVISFENVSFAYDAPKAKKKQRNGNGKPDKKLAAWGNSPDAVWALRDVNLTIRKGEFLGLAGHTGSGKSTLIQHMNGILHPTLGSVSVLGADIGNKKEAAQVRANVGVVFQYPEHQLFAETVYQDVAFGPRNLGLPEEEVDACVRAALERVGLDFEELRESSPFDLSGGQQRRVAFAGVLAMDPQVLVLDEPVAGLDPVARREFLSLIKRLHEQGLTIVMVSHSMDDLADLCDRIAVLKEGCLFAEGTPEDVFQQAAAMKEIGLGIPASQRLANSLIDAGAPLQRNTLYGEEELAQAIARLVHA